MPVPTALTVCPGPRSCRTAGWAWGISSALEISTASWPAGGGWDKTCGVARCSAGDAAFTGGGGGASAVVAGTAPLAVAGAGARGGGGGSVGTGGAGGTSGTNGSPATGDLACTGTGTARAQPTPDGGPGSFAPGNGGGGGGGGANGGSGGQGGINQSACTPDSEPIHRAQRVRSPANQLGTAPAAGTHPDDPCGDPPRRTRQPLQDPAAANFLETPTCSPNKPLPLDRDLAIKNPIGPTSYRITLPPLPAERHALP